MNQYFIFLQKTIQAEIDVYNSTNKSINCSLVSIEPVNSFYKLTIAPNSKKNHGTKEEERLSINNIVLTVVEVTKENFVCTSDRFIKLNDKFELKKCESNMEKIMKRFMKFVKKDVEICEKYLELINFAETYQDSKFISKNNTKDDDYQKKCIDDEENKKKCFDDEENKKKCFDDKKILIDESINKINLYDANHQQNNILINKVADLKISDSIEFVNESIYTFSKKNKFVEDDNLIDNVEFNDRSLNESQKSVIYNVIKNESFKIIGPPGTGKTRTILEIIYQILKQKKKILVCGPSNTSVDNILSKFINLKKETKSSCLFFRLGSSLKCFDGFEKYNLNIMANNHVNFLDEDLKSLKITKNKETCKVNKTKEENKKFDYKTKKSLCKIKVASKEIYELNKDKNNRKKEFCKENIKNADIVFSTLYSASKVDDTFFDYVIIDECCQALEVEAFLAIICGKNFILAGDPFQLGPVILSNSSDKTLFDRINVKTIFLNEQYRMCEKLISFSNSFFYKNKIISNTKEEFLFLNENNIFFIDTINSFYSESILNQSRVNEKEAEIIIRILSFLSKNHKNMSIGVISLYSAQTELIKNLIKDSDLNLQISTVDSFQGQEKDIIIFSLVRSNDDEEIGFLEEIRRTNVAITRCKKGLFVVGDSGTFRKCRFYEKFVDFLYENGLCLDPENFYNLFDDK